MSSIQKDLEELTDHIRKEVESMAEPGEKWTVGNGPKIYVDLRGQIPACGHNAQINESNCHNLEAVMKELRSKVKKCEDDLQEYTKALLKKCGTGGGRSWPK